MDEDENNDGPNVTRSYSSNIEENVSGGGYTERTYTRPEYKDTAQTKELNSQLERLRAERAAYRTEIKDMGVAGKEIMQDPNIQAYKEQDAALREQIKNSREIVNPGGFSETVYDRDGFEVSSTFTPNRDPTTVTNPTPQYTATPSNDPAIEFERDEAYEQQNQQTAYDADFDVFNVNPQNDPYFSAAQDELDFQAEIDADLADAELQTLEAVDPYAGTAMTDDEYEYAQSDGIDPYAGSDMTDDEYTYDPSIVAAEQAYAQQRSIKDARKTINKNDWRFRVRLSPLADYLYNSASPGILAPLRDTDGVIFPYVPSITVSNNARYASYDLTHSNYRGYFYSGSHVDSIVVNGEFTAQDTAEANYLLATMHFFKSATKMFYGQDKERGTPPPLLYMTGMGEYQFNEHPCVLTVFQYTLPDNVDYIKTTNDTTTGNQFLGRNLTGGYQGASSVINRLISSGLDSIFGAPSVLGSIGTSIGGITKITDGATYVPTRINLSLTFLPVNTREQISKDFSLRDFASGALIKKGIW